MKDIADSAHRWMTELAFSEPCMAALASGKTLREPMSDV